MRIRGRVSVRTGVVLLGVHAAAFCPCAFASSPDRVTVPGIASEFREELDQAAPERAPVLPSYNFSPDIQAESLASGATYRVTRIEVTGYTVLSEADVQTLTARYTGRDLTFQDLVALRDALTQAYVERGYVTSGAVIVGLDQGVLRLRAVEGELTEIRVTDEGRLRSAYVADYLRGFGPLKPVNVYDVEERLQILQQQPYIERVEAQLVPGDTLGESVLLVRPVEGEGVVFRGEFSNQQTPAVGHVQGIVMTDFLNVSGRGDNLHAGYRGAEGLDEFEGEYNFPLGARGTRLAIYGFWADSDIVSSPFDELDIKAKTWTVGARARIPLVRAVAGDTTFEVGFEGRRSKTYLLGSGFSFIEGPDEGKVQLAIGRMALENLHRTRRDVLFNRLELSVGMDVLGATSGSDGSVPDGEFVKLRLQSQWAHRLDFLDSQTILRLDAQAADDPLFGLEQFPVGGRWTVRGYRENTLIRDNAVVASAEWRIPLVRDARGISRFEVRPFFDWSYSDNRDREDLRRNTLSSVGLGLYWAPVDALQAEVYWGEPLQTVDYPGHDELQDNGISFRVTWEAR